jgi:multiple sugar transport system ATP-binding protein
MGFVRVDRLTKRFGDVLAVDDVSLEIADGEFLVLVGPSGCGKTTTLRCIAGLESPSEGQILLDGDLLNYTEPQDRDIAMVFQDYALYPHMTVRGNLRFGLQREADLDGRTVRERVEDTAALLEIADLLDRKPGELSGGQQQRVALGRAIVRDPAVFLMDEPLSNLDAKLRSQMRAELLRLQEDLGVTTVYVTHNQTEAMTMGDRIAVMRAGRLQQVGTPLECYREPANRFVAEFIGEPSMNFFEMERDGDALVGDGFEYGLSERVRDAVGDRTDLVLGVRPEDVELLSDADGEHDYPAAVDIVEPTGDEKVVYLTFTDGTSLVAVLDGTVHIDADDEVVARLPERVVHLFDAESGDALRNRAVEVDERPA